MKKIALIVMLGGVLLGTSCKKKDNNSNNNNNSTPPTVTTCFKDEQEGNYFGNGVQNGIPFNSANVSITKLSCTSIKIQAPNSTYTISSLNASGSNGYSGTSNTSESASVSFSVSGSQCTVDIAIGNSFQFTGTK